MFDFFVIGDIMVDNIILVSDPEVVRTVDEISHRVTLPFPTKIHLSQPPRQHLGGNAFNASMAMKWLGLNIGMYSIIGSDQIGDHIFDELQRVKIDTTHVVRDPDNGTNQATIINIANDRIVLSHHHTRNYNLPDIPDTKFVYLTSIGEDDSTLLKQVVEQRNQKGFKLLFTPGTRQVTEPFTEIKEVLENTDILVLNKREAIAMSRLKTDSDEHLLRGLHRFGPKTVVMTRSAKGALAFDGENIIKVGTLNMKAVDSTGAGDTFCATLGMCLGEGHDLKTSMEMASINSANVISQIGATNGLLNYEQLQSQHAQKADMLQYQESTTHQPPAQQ